jgi:hypothetical protein
MRNKLGQFSRAILALGQGLIGKFLNSLLDFSALTALILVDRHFFDFLLILAGSMNASH